jgi:hypothetical protein
MRRSKFTAAVAAGLMLLSTAAFADDFVASEISSTGELAVDATRTATITLVATDDGPGKGCNIKNAQQYVVAAVTSSNTGVATVSPAEWEFNDCGESFVLTITAVACGSATVTISKDSSKTQAGKNARFSDETLSVTVAGDCHNGGGDPTVCAEPAAPAWAAAILKANNIKAKQATNLISEVAKMMTQGATFDGVAKSDQAEYAAKVYTYLDGRTGGLPVTNNYGQAIRPGWVCT